MNNSILQLIKNNKNYYDTDIDIKSFIQSINILECKNYKDIIDNHTKDFFYKDKNESESEIIGYYVCNGEYLFKFYIIKVTNIIYMALENTPPYFWYPLTSYKDFRLIRKIYNKKTDIYEKKILLIGTELLNLENNDIIKNINNDYEYTMILYNMCKLNPFIYNDIFYPNEFHYNVINRNKLSSLENALLDKKIIMQNKGFYCHTSLTNSIISIKCIQGVIYLICQYDECQRKMPIDLEIFLSNFKLTDIKTIINNCIEKDLIKINNSIPLDFYYIMKDEIYNILEYNKNKLIISKEYKKILRQLFTKHCVNRVMFGFGDNINLLKNRSDKFIRKLLYKYFSKEELKYISKKYLKQIKFT
jgi:hypothetical protein